MTAGGGLGLFPPATHPRALWGEASRALTCFLVPNLRVSPAAPLQEASPHLFLPTPAAGGWGPCAGSAGPYPVQRALPRRLQAPQQLRALLAAPEPLVPPGVPQPLQPRARLLQLRPPLALRQPQRGQRVREGIEVRHQLGDLLELEWGPEGDSPCLQPLPSPCHSALQRLRSPPGAWGHHTAAAP